MSAPYVYLDTETTGLDPYNDEIWEIAWIIVDEHGAEAPHQLFVRHDAGKVAALPREFRIDWAQRYDARAAVEPEVMVNRLLASIPEKAHLVGACPWFDQEFLRGYFDAASVHLPWHYHLIDVEALAVGSLATDRNTADVWAPPWDSERLSRAVGVDPDRFERHTALGDAQWAQAIHRAVMA